MGTSFSLQCCLTPTSPDASSLTAERLAQYEASPACVSDDSPSCPVSQRPAPNETLATAGSNTTSSREASSQRRQARRRRERRSRDDIPVAAVLSNLPEVAGDIQYRFRFVVVGVGSTAQEVIQLTCGSGAARRWSCSGARLQPAPPPTGPHSAAGAPRDLSCLAALTAPTGQVMESKLVKLAFHPVGLGSRIPACTSHVEALNSLVVLVLTVDGPLGSQDRLTAQLRSVLLAADRSEAMAHHKLRPVRVLLLGSTMKDEDKDHGSSSEVSWPRVLEDFDDAYGRTCKFGPLPLWNGDALHATFTEMASSRILQLDGDEAGDPDRGPQCLAIREQEDSEEDGGEEAAGYERTLLQKQFQLRNTDLAKKSGLRSLPRSSSEPSRDRQEPLVLDADVDGEVPEAHAGAEGTRPAALKFRQIRQRQKLRTDPF